MSKRKKIILIVIGSVLLLVFIYILPFLLCARANNALARELRPQFERWLETVPQIPDSENGALIILKGLNSLGELPDEYYGSLDEELEKDAKLVKLMREYLAENIEALRLVEEGLGYKKWQYPVDYAAGYEATLPHVMLMSTCKDSFMLRARYAELDGQNSRALQEYMKTLKLGTTLADGRFIISGLVEIAVYITAQRKLVPLIAAGSFKEHELVETLETLCRLYKSRGSYTSRMESDVQLFFKIVVDCIEKNYSLEEIISIVSLGWGPRNTPAKLVPAKYVYDFRPSVEIFRKNLEIQLQLDPARYYEHGKRFEDDDAYFKELGIERKSWRTALAVAILPSLTGCYKKFAISEAYWRATIAVAAIKLSEKRNGQLPISLGELSGLVSKELLIDPFSGKQLVYRLKGENDFCLYSVGLDGVDSKCEDTREFFDLRADEGEPDDIIFHAPRKP